MKNIAIQLENISKQYRLGVVGTGTLGHDLNRWFAKLKGKDDPTLKVGSYNKLDTVEGKYVWALKDVNLEIKKGEVVGLVGKNGAGKSTLLKVLSRVTSQTTGTIRINGRVASLLEVGTGFHPELTGKENIYLNGAILGMTKKEIARKFDDIVEFSGVKKYVDTPVKRYSSGMYVRLAFAVAAHLEPEILIVDEVLAVGDAEFQRKAIGKMQDVANSGRTVIFVSHNLTAVEQLCTSAALIENGTLTMQGPVSEVLDSYKKSVFEDDSYKRSGNRQVEFLEQKILDVAGNPINEVCLGQDIVMYAKVKFNDAIDYTDLSLDIRNDANEFISHITNMDDDFRIENFKKDDTLELRVSVKNVSLAPGSYFISVWLGNNYGTFDYIENCLPFQVKQGEEFIKRNYPFDRRSKTVLQSQWSLVS